MRTVESRRARDTVRSMPSTTDQQLRAHYQDSIKKGKTGRTWLFELGGKDYVIAQTGLRGLTQNPLYHRFTIPVGALEQRQELF